jgi:hypothetical protein
MDGDGGPTIQSALTRYPVAVAAMTLVAVPCAVVGSSMPAPVSWFLWLTALMLGWGAATAVAAAGSAPGADRPRGVDAPLWVLASARGKRSDSLRRAARTARHLLGATVLLGGALVAVAGSMLLAASLLDLGLFGSYLSLVAAAAIAARFALVVPAIVIRDLAPLDAVELSWELVETWFIESAGLLALLVSLVVAVAAASALAAQASGLGVPATAGVSMAAACLVGPLVPLVFVALLDPMEQARRLGDPFYGRP